MILTGQGAHSASNSLNISNQSLTIGGGDPYTDTIGRTHISCTRDTLSFTGKQDYDEDTQRSTGTLALNYTMVLGNSNCEKAEKAMYNNLSNRYMIENAAAARKTLLEETAYEAAMEDLRLKKFKVADFMVRVCASLHHKILADKESPLYAECAAYVPIDHKGGDFERVSDHVVKK